jgi:protein-tyrosine phosphatase
MRNIFWLRKGVIGGRSGPNRDVWSAADLAESGIGAVLSVNNGELVHVADLVDAGIDYKCVPLSEAAPPRVGDLEMCVEALPKALEYAQDVIGSGRTVLVHCTSGKDRTGMFLSYYLCASEGLLPLEAIREVKRVRPIALTAEGWEEFTVKVLGALVA